MSFLCCNLLGGGENDVMASMRRKAHAAARGGVMEQEYLEASQAGNLLFVSD